MELSEITDSFISLDEARQVIRDLVVTNQALQAEVATLRTALEPSLMPDNKGPVCHFVMAEI